MVELLQNTSCSLEVATILPHCQASTQQIDRGGGGGGGGGGVLVNFLTCDDKAMDASLMDQM